MDELDRQARRKARRVGQSQPRSAGPVDERPIGDQEDRPKKRRLSFEQSVSAFFGDVVRLLFFSFFGAQDPVLR